ncbi:MAG: hypothetical protein DWQ34_16650 [Planctomycetota bacterium]|nr:MAG: hypothetical protein DWQ34_16650 [Planctomycetota bacterium]REK30754.1 MAG: hypothetical protein DWQ41_02050 [Planctomycetota bacterium]
MRPMPAKSDKPICPGPVSRREWLRIGGLSLGALAAGLPPSLAQLLVSEQESTGDRHFISIRERLLSVSPTAAPSVVKTATCSSDSPSIPKANPQIEKTSINKPEAQKARSSLLKRRRG